MSFAWRCIYAFPDIRKPGYLVKVPTGLLNSENVAAVPGDAFGVSGEGFLRCCYATDISNKSAMNGCAIRRIDKVMNGYDP